MRLFEWDMTESEGEPIPCPPWVADEVAVHGLLSQLIDKLERNVAARIKINPKTTPQLYDFNGLETDYLWGLIEQLGSSYQMLTIKMPRPKLGKVPYDGAVVTLETSQEDLVRQWIGRPKSLPYAQQWQLAVQHYAVQFPTTFEFLSNNSLRHRSATASQVVKSLLTVKTTLVTAMTMRALSAKCFNGDSKFLDNKEDYIRSLYPELAINIRPRALLVNAYIPIDFSAVLFIENQDTFLLLCQLSINDSTMRTALLADIALVYCAGFRGSATRIREAENAQFSFIGQPTAVSLASFENWWLCTHSENKRTYFWGDLDYSGLAILSALRQTFPNTEAWPAGYQAMARSLKSGYGHTFDIAGKENQTDPGSTGCLYADQLLLPLIREKLRFLDQEAIDQNDLLADSGESNHGSNN
jgi:hypothetical protein